MWVKKTELKVPRGMFAVAHAIQENVLAESSMMVPETRQRLEAALSDLQSYVVGVSSTAVAAIWQQAGPISLKGMIPHFESLPCHYTVWLLQLLCKDQAPS